MAVSGDLSLATKVKEVEARIRCPEEMLGNTLMMPFTPACSAQRKIMFAQHLNQHLNLIHGEVPLVCTGFEDEFAKYSSSYHVAEHEYTLIKKIQKFSKYPGRHYYAILLNTDTGELSVIERVEYAHTTEAFGFLYNNDGIDSYDEGNIIPEGTILEKSAAYDEFGGHCDGVNLLSTYLAIDDTMEDSILISESAAKKLVSPSIKTVSIIINDNDMLLDLYGDGSTYKTFPDIGEHVKDGIICAIRREKKEESLYTQARTRLQEILMSDDKITMDGTLIDINVYCNNPDTLQQSYYNGQIREYYNDNIRFSREVVAIVDQYPTNPKSIELQQLYKQAQRLLAGDGYIKDKPFSSICIDLTTYEENVFSVGDKLSNRYGGKGVVSKILPDDEMPILDNGERIELIFNSSTCVNRLNPSQLFEMSLTHIGNRIIDFIKTNVLDVNEQIELYEHYVKAVNPELGAYVSNFLEAMEECDAIEFIGSILNDKGIRLSMNPISNSLTIDDIAALYEEFPWVKQYTLMVPIEDSNGNVRFVNSRRPIVAGRQYIYRLKQYAEEKFSVTSLSATNIKNENSRSKANKTYRCLYTKTPIRFGEMESGDMMHLGAEYVVINLMLYSTSPNARRLTESLLTGDAFNIDIRLDSNSKSRNVEILNTQLKTMGLRLVFIKRRKKLIHPFIRNPFIHLYADDKPPAYAVNPFIHHHPDEVVPKDYYEKMWKQEHMAPIHPFIRNPFIHLIYEDEKKAIATSDKPKD